MNVKLVYGCPCSGKTTYVRDRVGEKDIVYDYDAFAKAMRLASDHPVDPGVSGVIALDLRQPLADLMLNSVRVETFWFICTWPSDRILEILKMFDDVEKVFIDADKDTCIERMENDDTRVDKEAWRAVIDRWFDQHEAEIEQKRKETKTMKDKNRFWRWTNTAETAGSRTLTIDGEIASESWFGDEVTPKLFRDELYAGSGDVVLYINSPGGDCIAASQIYTMLMEYVGNVTVRIDGMAASAASVISMAGTTVEMAPTAMMMIHNPATMAWGDHNDMQKAIELLDEVKEAIINAYEIKTGLSRAKISRLMEDETWMNAKKALDLGFIDAIMTGETDSNLTETEAYTYSGHSAENALRRKLIAKYGEKPVTNTGRRVDSLLARLNAKKI